MCRAVAVSGYPIIGGSRSLRAPVHLEEVSHVSAAGSCKGAIWGAVLAAQRSGRCSPTVLLYVDGDFH